MKFKTKQQRLQATVGAYRDLIGRPFTMEEVSAWAIANNLYPTPKRGDPDPICEAWEFFLDEAVKAWPRGRDNKLAAWAEEAIAAMDRDKTPLAATRER
jgi:hypothetical protein